MTSLVKSLDEAVLIKRAQQDDAAAFRRLYALHSRYLAGVVFRLLGDDADLEDVVQEAFLDAARAIGALRQSESLRPWLVSIAVRRVHRHLAAQRRRRFIVDQFSELSAFVGVTSSRAAAHELYDALGRLPASVRIPWSLRHVEQMTLPEVADNTRTSLSTTKRRIQEAQTRLERLLGKP